jgi:hypothetical protein
MQKSCYLKVGEILDFCVFLGIFPAIWDFQDYCIQNS